MVKQIWLIEDETSIRFDGMSLRKGGGPGRKDFVGVVLQEHDLRTYTFKLPLTVSEEKLETMVEIRMYEEGGLDPNKNYAVGFVKHPLDFDQSWLIEAFAVETEKLKAQFGKIARKIGHIDLIAPPYLVYEGLYAFELLKKSKVDLFIHLSERESFAVLCKDGRYITHRSLPTLESLALKANVPPSVLVQALKEKGVQQAQYGLEEMLIYTTLSESMTHAVERIAQTVNHKRGIFGISGVDEIHLDFQGSEIPGLWDIFDAFEFKESVKNVLRWCEEIEADDIHRAVEGIYLLAAAQEKLTPVNLTVFEKRPAWWSTHVGKLIAVTAASVIVTVVWGAYESGRLERLEARKSVLENRYREITDKTKKLTAALKSLRNERAGLDKKLSACRGELARYDEAMDTMSLIVASKLKRWQMFKDVDRALAAYKLSALTMEQNGSRSIAVEVLTPFKTRENIAKFMKSLIAKGYQGVQTDLIELEKNLYKSRVEIVR